MNLSEAIAKHTGTTLCVSLAQRPGTFGKRIHNAAYRALNINFVYEPCFCDDIKAAMELVREHGVRGCSITMPFKETVLAYLDAVDDIVAMTGAVNTVSNSNGILTGYNTDVHGMNMILQHMGVTSDMPITVLGTGGVAKSTLVALRDHKHVRVMGRDPVKLATIGRRHNVETIMWNPNVYGVVINCTSVGMADELLPIGLDGVQTFIDVVGRVTPMVQACQQRGIPATDGQYMALHQAYKQFEIYTGMTAPMSAMLEAIK